MTDFYKQMLCGYCHWIALSPYASFLFFFLVMFCNIEFSKFAEFILLPSSKKQAEKKYSLDH